MSTRKQRALFVRELAKPMVLGERPIPTPKPNQVLIKIAATQLLPHDQKARDIGLLIGHKLPFILGNNVAGSIVQLGSAVTTLAVGDSIFGLGDINAPTPDHCGLQEFAVLNDDAIAKTPPGFTPDQAATLPINLLTSAIALFASSSLGGLGFPAPFAPEAEAEASPSPSTTTTTQHESLVILAAGSGVGRYAVQLATIAGIRTIVAVAGPASEADLRDMGATHVLSRHLPPADLVSAVHAITGGPEGVTRLWQCHGRDVEVATALLAWDRPSRLRTVHHFTAAQAAGMGAARPLCEARFVQCSNDRLAPHGRAFWTQVGLWVGEGRIRPGTGFRVVEGLERLGEIEGALGGYRDGSGRGEGQVVVRP